MFNAYQKKLKKLSCDLDSCNKKQREILYQKKLDILLKLATLQTFSVKEAVEEEREETGIKGFQATTWDLKKDFDAESKPD